MFHKKLDNSCSKKSYSSKKIIGACLIATALTFNVFLSDPTDSSTLRSEPQRTLVTLVDDKTNLSATFTERIARRIARLKSFTFTTTREEVIPEPEKKTTVFYNVDTHPDSKSLAIDIVNEQMEQIPHEHQVFVRLIGPLIDVPSATSIQHDEFGYEIETLGLLWDHCQKHPDERVIFIHSFYIYAHEKNNMRRKFLTRGALSQECLDMPSTCDICSSRMSIVPHVHTSGNMWSAKCDYVQKLINPLEFQAKMALIYGEGDDWMVGTGQMASEHWVHSHPSVRSCDLSTGNYTWNYENVDNVPQGDFEMKLRPAPRFELKAYETENISLRPLKNYLKEYVALYNETPGDDWWGWKLRER